VAGSRIAVQVTHQLGKSSGGTFNLESDLDHLEIHVSYEPGVHPGLDHAGGKALANAGMIQAQIAVVFTVQVEETSARYVRVVAVDKTGNKSGPSDAATATALLIDDAHISDLTVSKVTAGTVSASWVDGRRDQNSGRRRTRPSSTPAATGLRLHRHPQTVPSPTARRQRHHHRAARLRHLRPPPRDQPHRTFLPEIRFYANTGTNFAYINDFTSSGTDANLGMNIRAGVDGRYSFDQGKFGWNPNDSTNGQYHNYSSGRTRHVGRWGNFISAASNEGIFTGTDTVTTVASSSYGFGATMLTTMVPIVTLRASNFGTATPTVWGVQSINSTGFTVAWNNSQTMNINWWVYRV
jgi:hypothetical protein